MMLKTRRVLFALASLLYACGAMAQEVAPIDLFNTGNDEWNLAFRGTAFIQQSAYDAYVHGTSNVDIACKQTLDTNLPCQSHYRSPILDEWKNIDDVAFVIYKSGILQKYAIFNGIGSTSDNWFDLNRLTSSSWPDLKVGVTHNFFSISGDAGLKRRFFMEHNYGGCGNDAGWTVVVDQASPACQWEKDEGYPMFMYSTSNSSENWNTGMFAKADVVAVYVKYRVPEILPFVDLFGTGKTEWRIVFRGTSHINKSVYDAYLHGSAKVDLACKQPDSNIGPCDSHYRSSILDDWKDIVEVAFVVYKSGIMQKYAIFDGRGTGKVDWFSDGKLIRSSWSDLRGKQQFFSITGDQALQRRFFIQHSYGGCDKDSGWFVAKDGASKPCGWESLKTYPLFLYSTSNSTENWTKGQVSEADVIAIYVKFGSPNPAVG